MFRTSLIAGAMMLVVCCNNKMEKTPAGVCAKMQALAEGESPGAQLDKAECLAMMADYPERDAAGFAVLAACMEAANDVNGVQGCLLKGFAFAAETEIELDNEPTQVARSDIKIDREVTIRANPRKGPSATKSDFRLAGKFLADVTREDLAEVIQEKGWKYEGGSTIMGASDIVTVEGIKNGKKMVITIIRPSEDAKDAPEPEAEFFSQQKRVYESDGAVYVDGDILIAVEIDSDRQMAKQMLDALIKS